MKHLLAPVDAPYLTADEVGTVPAALPKEDM